MRANNNDNNNDKKMPARRLSDSSGSSQNSFLRDVLAQQPEPSTVPPFASMPSRDDIEEEEDKKMPAKKASGDNNVSPPPQIVEPSTIPPFASMPSRDDRDAHNDSDSDISDLLPPPSLEREKPINRSTLSTVGAFSIRPGHSPERRDRMNPSHATENLSAPEELAPFFIIPQAYLFDTDNQDNQDVITGENPTEASVVHIGSLRELPSANPVNDLMPPSAVVVPTVQGTVVDAHVPTPEEPVRPERRRGRPRPLQWLQRQWDRFRDNRNNRP